jgi:hypothetical protein
MKMESVTSSETYLWVVTPCSQVEDHRNFEATYRLYLQDTRLNQTRALFATCFTLVLCLAYSSTMKMAITCTSETSADFQRTARRYIPQDTTLRNISGPVKRLSVSKRMELVTKYLLRQNWNIIILTALQPFVGPRPLFQFLDPIHSS